MKVRGPKGAMTYAPNMVRHFGMIAGGTGITPMLQIVRAIIRGRKSKGGNDKTEIDLIFANVNEEDILLKQDLDQLASEDSGFRVHYVLNNPPAGWTGGVGFVTGDIIKVCDQGLYPAIFIRKLTLHVSGQSSSSCQRHQDPSLRTTTND